MVADRVHRAATTVAAWVRRGSRGDAVPLGDTHDLERPARRTRLVRLGLAVALVAALLAAVASIPGPHGRRFLPADTVAMVVLDLSSSIRPTTYKLIGFELGVWIVMHKDLRNTRRMRLMFDHLPASLAAYIASEAA